MTISFYKALIIIPIIRITLVSVLSNIWRLGLVRNTKFGKSVSNKMLLDTVECQCLLPFLSYYGVLGLTGYLVQLYFSKNEFNINVYYGSFSENLQASVTDVPYKIC